MFSVSRSAPGERLRGFAAVRDRIGRHAWSLLTFLGVGGALLATVSVVRGTDGAKDSLRQAQVAFAVAPRALFGVLASPEALLAGTPVGPTEVPINKALRDSLNQSMLVVNREWPTKTTSRLRAEAALMTRRAAEMMGLLVRHRLTEARLRDNALKPLGERLESGIAAANSQLGHQITAAGRRATRATVGVVGVVGVLLMLSLLGLASSRRRRLRSEIEQGVLRDGERRLQALVEHGSDMITVVKPDTTVIYQAGAVGPMLGYLPTELLGARFSDRLDPDDVPSLLVLCATESTATGELRLRHRDGSKRTCEVHATNLLDDPAWEAIVLNIWDLSARKALEERLRHQALHDPLTGVANRVLAVDRAELMLARARREHVPVAALYIDIDGFKHVNDTFGHAAGDALLRIVANRLSSLVREGDTVARLGGDEFAVLVEGSALDAGPELVAEHILEALRQPYALDAAAGRQLPLSVSIGIAYGMPGNADELLQDADVALYEAKAAGKNCHVVFESGMQTVGQDRLMLEMDLAQALEKDELFLLYQPLFDLRSEQVIGLEALIRWRHPTRGVISPVEFIPIAKESGLIIPIGRWVLEEACRQIVRWRACGHMIGVSVNVSGRQLDNDGLIEDVHGALEQSELDPTALTLEITETMLMRDAERSAERLRELKQLGVRVAVDDFGTGYSSLAYLRQFPVDSLKIDRSLIDAIATSTEAAALIRTLVQLGHTLHIETLAEGIEDRTQLEVLQREHCDHGQGFLFSRPLDVSAVEPFLQSSSSLTQVLEAR